MNPFHDRAIDSAISGVHVDSSALIGFDLGARLGGLSPAESSSVAHAATAEAREAGFLAKMESLRADRRAGIIDQAEFEELKSAYRRVYEREHGATTRADAA